MKRKQQILHKMVTIDFLDKIYDCSCTVILQVSYM